MLTGQASANWTYAAGDDSQTLKPTFWGLARLLLVFAVLAGTGVALALLPDNPGHPDHHVKGLVAAILGGALAIRILVRAATGFFDLTISPYDITYGKKCYGWAMVTGGFVAGTGRRRNIVTFTAAGKKIPIVNCYGIPTASLVALLNGHGAGASGNEFATTAPPAARNLPVWAWVPILTVFVIVMLNIRMITNVAWLIVSPGNYATHHFDDQSLGDEAGRYPNMLPVLLQRAEAGDRSAMYFYGDLFDPGDFICETTVQKNPATAILWYRRAIALDDQGAERNLAVMYHTGDGVLRDDAMAAQLFERAVAHNDDFGDYYLGQMLETGEGEPQNLTRAVQLEAASAAQGQALGQVELGRMYFNGIGVAADASKAAAEWRLAAAQGNRQAQDLLKQNGLQ